jgi:hypothetical protein
MYYKKTKKKTLTTQYNLFYRFFQANMCKSLYFCLICNKLYAYGTFSLVGKKYISFDIGCFTLIIGNFCIVNQKCYVLQLIGFNYEK